MAIEGFALVNYRCGLPSGGAHRKNRTSHHLIIGHQATAGVQIQTGAPSIPESNYTLNGVSAHSMSYTNSTFMGQIMAERGVGDNPGDGWVRSTFARPSANLVEGGSAPHITPIKWVRRRSSLNGIDMFTSRRWALQTTALGTHPAVWLEFTYHTITFTVSGIVEVDGAPVADGKTVEVFSRDSDNVIELVGSAVTSGGTGAFSLQVPDNTRTYWASYKDGTNVGRSDNAVPGVGPFDISIGGAEPDATPPVISIVSPNPGPWRISIGSSGSQEHSCCYRYY
jgi:hypothetical protein